MQRSFCTRYGLKLDSAVISNLAFFEPQLSAVEEPSSFKMIGYMSNITFDKGIDTFLDLMEQLKERGSALRAKIAGPFGDSATEQYVMSRIGDLDSIEYVGPVYGEAKERFLSSLDFFVFPTRYKNEAQPMVIYEAKLKGLPVAVSDRGSLGEMVDADDILLDAEGADIDALVEMLLEFERNPDLYVKARKRTIAARKALISAAKQNSREFIELFNLEVS
jgi:glycosyltransferase involved in cell wall biosynthesis